MLENTITYAIVYNMYDEELSTIGQYTRDARLAENLGQQELFDASGLSRSVVSRIENGNGCELATLLKILEALDKLDDFMYFFQRKVNPLDLIEAEERGRKRTRKKRTPAKKSTGTIKWGDE